MSIDVDASPLDRVVSHPVTTGDDLLAFVSCFDWWEIRRANSGSTFRIVVGVRLKCGEYAKAHGRQGESAIQVTERLRLRLAGYATDYAEPRNTPPPAT